MALSSSLSFLRRLVWKLRRRGRKLFFKVNRPQGHMDDRGKAPMRDEGESSRRRHEKPAKSINHRRKKEDLKISIVPTTKASGFTSPSIPSPLLASSPSSPEHAHTSLGGSTRPHTGGDRRWEVIRLAEERDSPLGLGSFKMTRRLGFGDIGSVYLVELRGSGKELFAMKVMDKASLASRNKLIRAKTEREILGLLDHPFLPTLYSHFETEKFYCLVMEYCSGGNLHSLRQKQPGRYFTEKAARFYTTEVLLALEYLHMLGIIYRDLKPENVLVREEGHIMLSDFDLSLRCTVSPTLVKSSSHRETLDQGCIQPSHLIPRLIPKKSRKSKSDFGISTGSLPELMAEPTSARSMSFVGTHEYLAPEIIRGEGHGSAVDWWTLGIFLYELLHGVTPFKGQGNRATLFNVVGQPLRFPDKPVVSAAARDLIKGLLVKDPQKRIAYRRGATEIKQHPFFEGVNWALVRSAAPPHVPEVLEAEKPRKGDAPLDKGKTCKNGVEGSNGEHRINGGERENREMGGGVRSGGTSGGGGGYVEFEYF